MAAQKRKVTPKVRPSKSKASPRTNHIPTISGGKSSAIASQFMGDMVDFCNQWRRERFDEFNSALAESMIDPVTKKKTTKRKINVKASTIMAAGANSEHMMMQALGWYWEPLTWDLNFYAEMRDSITLIDGQVNKIVDLAMDGFSLHCETDPEAEAELNEKFVTSPDSPDSSLRAAFRRAMVDIYSLGNCYARPIYTKDDKGRKTLKTMKPIRASAMRILRDEDLMIEGYVQLLHRPAEFLWGMPSTPTVWRKDQVCYGRMREQDWKGYGRPIVSPLGFVLKMKLQVEREMTEMLHQHLPRVDITYTPEEQATNDQIKTNKDSVKSEVAAMRPNDNFIHTPDLKIEYIGPNGHQIDMSPHQKHVEQQIFYIFPLSPAIMGVDNTVNPMDSQQRWTVTSVTADLLRKTVVEMHSPVLNMFKKEWKLNGPITIGWSPLDPTRVQQNAEAEEYTANNAVLKRDNGFIDQDTAARQATSMHKGGSVKKAAAPGALPPPIDPNQIDPKTGKPYPSGKSDKKVAGKKTPANRRVRRAGPKGDGTKVPDKDNRPRGKRHGQKFESVLLSQFAASIDRYLDKLSRP